MTTDVVNQVSLTMESQESDGTKAGHGGRRLPTAGEVMSRNPRTVDSQASLFSAWRRCTANTINT